MYSRMASSSAVEGDFTDTLRPGSPVEYLRLISCSLGIPRTRSHVGQYYSGSPLANCTVNNPGSLSSLGVAVQEIGRTGSKTSDTLYSQKYWAKRGKLWFARGSRYRDTVDTCRWVSQSLTPHSHFYAHVNITLYQL